MGHDRYKCDVRRKGRVRTEVVAGATFEEARRNMPRRAMALYEDTRSGLRLVWDAQGSFGMG